MHTVYPHGTVQLAHTAEPGRDALHARACEQHTAEHASTQTRLCRQWVHTSLLRACRQCLFGGLRIGLYDPVKTLYVGKDWKGDVPFHLKVAAGLTTGALAICIASPTDLVKVRMQV